MVVNRKYRGWIRLGQNLGQLQIRSLLVVLPNSMKQYSLLLSRDVDPVLTKKNRIRDSVPRTKRDF